ncbi:alpha/beta-hydrolase [Clavulina sp. PMI_390]|nr:alpha/beta-hydrolase [Clavulina sp. PMI_390]
MSNQPLSDSAPGPAPDADEISVHEDIHEALRELREKEIVRLAHTPKNLRSTFAANNYVGRVVLETSRYVAYFVETWFWFAITSCLGGLGPFDWLTMLFFAAGGTIVLFVALIFCLTLNLPVLVSTYRRWSKKSAGGLGLANNLNPNLFKSMTTEQVDAAKEFLSRDITQTQDYKDRNARYFNYDAAKLLLQFAAIVYEHRKEPVQAAVAAQSKGVKKRSYLFASHLKEAVKVSDVEQAELNREMQHTLAAEDDEIIRTFCRLHGIDFEPLSELNDSSSAFAGVFWDPNSNWIVVAFKGTSPVEFGEVLSDLNTKMVSVGSSIPGFKKVHKGFRERVYPEDLSKTGGIRPYDTMQLGIRRLARWLKIKNAFPESTKINVWMTGHSLGCATASLVYSRMLMQPWELGDRCILRDAYLFAAPILTDRESVDVFNAKMLEDPKKPRVMWRITSNWDAVATLLPDLGNYTSVAVSPNNAFAFAHLGTNILLRDDIMPYAKGNHIHYGMNIHMESKFSRAELEQQREVALAQDGERARIWRARVLQAIPLFGRVFAHFTPNYWDQLNRSGIEGVCEWIG